MKKLTLLSLTLVLVVIGYAQNRIKIPDDWKNFAVKRDLPSAGSKKVMNKTQFSCTALWPPEEEVIGKTYYDLQSYASIQNRIFVYDDGTVGAVFTFGLNWPYYSNDRGTGYNYYDGNQWDPYPTQRIEPDRTGWPAYSAWGENGEIFVACYSGATYNGLVYARRAEKGTGDWSLIDYLTPIGNELVGPKMTTGGINHIVIHQIAITRPIANGGSLYQGMDGALLYSRSVSGGDTWEKQDVLLNEINSNYYLAFSNDTYEIQAQGDNVAILYGNSWQDLGLLKSTDGGDTWTQNIIWQHPYPFWQSGQVTDTFYCTDGAHALAFDQNCMVHVVFGINRAYADEEQTYWFPLVGGVGYWNENRPAFSNTLNALNPYLEPGSELIEDYSLIGWEQDVNNNGVWDILGQPGIYNLGSSSMPQILIDEMNQLFVVYSSVTETYNSGDEDYRHLWCRYSPNGDWWGPFFDLTIELIHVFDECVFPSLASNSGDYFYLIYQKDGRPGLQYSYNPCGPSLDNSITFMKVLKEDVQVGIPETDKLTSNGLVLQNYPNPMNERTTIKYVLSMDARVKLKLFNGFGQEVCKLLDLFQPAGSYKVNFEKGNLNSGIYYYTLEAISEIGLQKSTNKMLITPFNTEHRTQNSKP
ncbi:MAG: T9SS type A sorting domain-containing protein [Bacteroidales bacterium]|nr:T9SS type A sorting domain-containing protein [Bacteroidales bacterium]